LKLSGFFRKFILAVFLYCVSAQCCRAQGNTGFFTPSPVPDNSRLVPLVGAQAFLYAGSMIGLNVLWYKNYAHSPFHFFNDNNEWQQMDKLGHILTAYTISRITAALYLWSGVRQPQCNNYAAGLGMAYQTNIEVFDGFSAQWGFSPGDMAANTIGAGLFLSEQALANGQPVMMKISFHPTQYRQYRPNELGENIWQEFIKDYNGQTYWLAFAISSFLPKGNKVPGWLCMDFGYGAEGMTGAVTNPVMYDSTGQEICFDRYRKFLCSLDVNLAKIPCRSAPLHTFLGAISFIKVPFPALEFSRGKFKFHILYF
jgi:hypothetical protein